MYNKARDRDNARESITNDTVDLPINKFCFNCMQNSSTIPKLEKKVDDIVISVSYDRRSKKRFVSLLTCHVEGLHDPKYDQLTTSTDREGSGFTELPL